ncbi:MAG: SpoVR family protein [Deltaproteobacteria bacterium]|nr:SpoVR family protein [Deltaproteobacteria bacterium]
MELIDQHIKKIMEGCKARAREAGLSFDDETLEYIVTNRDLLELSPKAMIPTLYDYWVHDVEVLKEKGKYELYPDNPYETVINTRPAISFYNDNNPDWLNVMIFYHVLAHIDFFNNNLFFRHTWDYDFCGQALSDKRVIANLRSEKGRWVDYVIEFTRGIDNLVGYHDELARMNRFPLTILPKRLNFYFDVFLQSDKKVNITEYVKEIERYNNCVKKEGAAGEKTFFTEVNKQYPEFEAIYEKSLKKKSADKLDLIQFLMENSVFLNREENKWMKSVMQIVRKTSLFLQPQIRTKIINEGWASYWHETLFLQDDRIKGHEVDFARVNAAVTSLPRVGLNPYALGMRLFYDIEEMTDKGKYSIEFEQLLDADKRKLYNAHTGKGRDFIFNVRENFSDFMLINTFVDQDFVTRNKLFVAGRRLNKDKMVWEYYIKSRNVKAYRQMLLDILYHPPHITIDPEKSKHNALYLIHHFEGKPLVSDFISNTQKKNLATRPSVRVYEEEEKPEIQWRRVLYTMENRKMTKKPI